MNPERPRRAHHPQRGGASGEPWLTAVAEAAAREAKVPVELLGEYLTLLADAAISGRRPREHELLAVRDLGGRAAERGVAADRVVELYLSAAWRLWRELPAVVRTRDRDAVRAAAASVLRVISDAVAILVDGYQATRKQMIRHEESLRREFIDDLLRGDPDVSQMVERAEPFGLDLGRPHQIALAAPGGDVVEAETAANLLERVILDNFGDREVLVAIKDGRVVVLVPSRHHGSPIQAASTQGVGQLMHTALTRLGSGHPWRVATGRAYPGSFGVARSYEEAREALMLGERLGLDRAVVHAHDLLIYRVLLRDQVAIVDLVHAVLGPLNQARGGADPLLQTLETYFATGEVATEAARRLHVSVRTVTYRLARVKALTGHDPGDPAQRFALQAAVLGARLLQWPRRDLPEGAQ